MGDPKDKKKEEEEDREFSPGLLDRLTYREGDLEILDSSDEDEEDQD